ncbi:BV/ODV-C42 protein [Thysanoplusia orichalcea nucleopolyhedrovirus]|uniref:BV/ODV-C42 protein n=1 Tax=Thysanoplusia orichalcea nucleopolyhedrovirus TaxID=101850 RepID=L0CK32_9ABAC|nr:BV/ODV-C42 protein [Thysanoplusia orichalcea nucleopolyhedrovirus]AGA16252.1 BV/ODV-C42 protein [Thysanoplusia orichalcea nucleopolyhedrovirus]
MSVVALFLEINKLRLKVDDSMQLAIWPQLFHLLSDKNQSVEFDTRMLIEFMVQVARKGQNAQLNNNAALASQYAAGDANVVDPAPARPVSRPVINLFARPNAAASVQQPAEELINMRRYRNAARKLIHHYSLNSTSSTEYKISDVVMTMIFLLRSEKYHPLFKMLETTFDDYTCRLQMTQVQTDTLLDAVRSLLEMPSTTVDLTTVDVMRSSFARCFNSPIMRYAKIVLLQNVALQRDKRTTIEELLIERGEKIQTLQPQQYINSGTEIPFCDDAEFLNRLLKHIDPYPLTRMYYNAANTMFYTTMENYAVSNCKFNIEDYNNIFKVMENIKKHSNKSSNDQDELNIYLGVQSANAKRKKY